jgi:hypothetical protein
MIGRTLLLAATFFLVSFGDTMTLPEPLPIDPPRPQFGTYPPDCAHLYDNGNHEAWAECMGVGYAADESR